MLRFIYRLLLLFWINLFCSFFCNFWKLLAFIGLYFFINAFQTVISFSLTQTFWRISEILNRLIMNWNIFLSFWKHCSRFLFLTWICISIGCIQINHFFLHQLCMKLWFYEFSCSFLFFLNFCIFWVIFWLWILILRQILIRNGCRTFYRTFIKFSLLLYRN